MCVCFFLFFYLLVNKLIKWYVIIEYAFFASCSRPDHASISGHDVPHTAARLVYYPAYCNTSGNNVIQLLPTPDTEKVSN